MRTRVLRSAGLLGLCLAGSLPLVAGAGCDNITAGQTAEDPNPPKLLRIILLDENSGDAVDILNERMPVKCSASKPCTAGGFGYPAPGCVIAKGMTEGLCPDPLQNRPVSVDALTIRVVFSKLLDPAIEKVDPNPKLPGKFLYTLTDGVISLVDAAGKAVDADVSYDNSGAPVETSDVAALPFGPALVIHPAGALVPGVEYSIKLDTTKIKDRKGQRPTDNTAMKPVALPDTYTKAFKVDGLHAVTEPDFSGPIAPNQFLRYEWNADIAADAKGFVKGVTLKKGATAVTVEAFLEQGGDPKACEAAPRVLNIVAVKKPGELTTLALGDYTLTIDGLKDASGSTAADKVEATFKVEGAPLPDDDEHNAATLVLISQCIDPNAPDLTSKPTDGGVPKG